MKPKSIDHISMHMMMKIFPSKLLGLRLSDELFQLMETCKYYFSIDADNILLFDADTNIENDECGYWLLHIFACVNFKRVFDLLFMKMWLEFATWFICIYISYIIFFSDWFNWIDVICYVSQIQYFYRTHSIRVNIFI